MYVPNYERELALSAARGLVKLKNARSHDLHKICPPLDDITNNEEVKSMESSATQHPSTSISTATSSRSLLRPESFLQHSGHSYVRAAVGTESSVRQIQTQTRTRTPYILEHVKPDGVGQSALVVKNGNSRVPHAQYADVSVQHDNNCIPEPCNTVIVRTTEPGMECEWQVDIQRKPQKKSKKNKPRSLLNMDVTCPVSSTIVDLTKLEQDVPIPSSRGKEEKASNDNSGEFESSLVPFSWTCQLCYKTHNSPFHLYHHFLSHFSTSDIYSRSWDTEDDVLNKNPNVGPDSNICLICGYLFLSETDLYAHLSSHRPAADAFVNFLLSEKGRALQNGRIKKVDSSVAPGTSSGTHQGAAGGIDTPSVRGKDEALGNGKKKKLDRYLFPLHWTCRMCGHSYFSPIYLFHHFLDHFKAFDIYTPRSIRAEWGLNDLNSSVGPTPSPCICNICGSSFSSTSGLQNHMTTHGATSDACISSPSGKEPNVKTKVCSNENPLKCPICNSPFDCRFRLEKHLKIHSQIVVNQLHSTTFLEMHKGYSARKVHRRPAKSSTPGKPTDKNSGTKSITFPCQICGKVFSLDSHRKEHQRSHTQEEINEITITSSETPSSSSSLSENADQLSSTHHESDTSEPDKYKYSCWYCPKVYEELAKVKRHLVSHQVEDPNLVKPTTSNSKTIRDIKYNCPVCPKTYPDKFKLESHLHNHAKKTSPRCPVCMRLFNPTSDIRAHLRNHIKELEKDPRVDFVHVRVLINSKTGQHSYRCLICNAVRSDTISMDRHLLVHSLKEELD